VQPRAIPPVPLCVPAFHSDPFAKVRSLGGTLVVLLGARAAARAVNYVVRSVTFPPPGEVTQEQLESMRLIDGVLLGLENLVTMVAMITFLVWIHRVFVAIRQTGGTTSWSPGMAVGGWFIPLANAILPWLTVRDALKALGRPTALAGAWWITWLLAMPLTMLFGLSRQLSLMPELYANLNSLPLDRFFEIIEHGYWPYVILDTATWVLLLLIVSSVRNAAAPRT
jgi:hypothetical protein